VLSRLPRTLTAVAVAFALWSGVTSSPHEPPVEVPKVHLSPYLRGNSQPAEPAGGAGVFPLYA
jgi:hypothetical protein